MPQLLLLMTALSMAANAMALTISPRAAVFDVFPYGYQQTGEPAQGMFVDVLHVVEKYSDVKMDITIMPLSRALRAVMRGDVDLMIAYKDPRRVPNINFLGNIGCIRPILVPRKDIELDQLQDLEGLRVGYISRGYFARRFLPQVSVIGVGVNSDLMMLRMLLRGRIDVMEMNDVALGALRQHPAKDFDLPDNWQQLLGLPLVIAELETHLTMSNASTLPGYADQLRTTLQQPQAQQEFQQIFQSYGANQGGRCAVKG